jgi:predicted PolB exonuclease-like 3'-5' exonuclease
MSNVIVWDIETVPDLKGFAAANGHDGKTDDEVRAELGDKFPRHIYHSIICIGALIAHREDQCRWIVDALGAPHVGERSEKELIASFVDKIAALSPQLITFNGASFDLPVLRYRAMVHGVPAPGLAARPYFHRTPRMQSIFAMYFPRLVPKVKQPFTSCAGSWDCPANSGG